MMRQFKRLFPTLIVLLSISVCGLNAQTIKKIKPSNANASAQEIKKLFGDLINVSAAQIENFYNHHWTPSIPYDNTCSTPTDAVIYQMNEADITFDWAPIPTGEVDNFTVRYLRLSDNSHDVFTTDNNSITVATPNDWFLFSFQSKCASISGAESASAAYIIIVERPVAFEESVSNCNNYVLKWHSSFSNLGAIPTYEWNPSSTNEKYRIVIQYLNFLTVSFNAGIQFDADLELPLAVTIDPNSFFNVHYDNFLYAHMPGNPSSELGIFSFAENPYTDEIEETPVFAFSPSEDANYPKGKIYLYRCRDNSLPTIGGSGSSQSFSSNSSSDIFLKEKSGSFETQKIIEYNLPSDENITIALYDNQGKLLKTVVDQKLESAGLHQQELDLSNYPGGLYFCILKTKTSSLPLKLIKAN